MFGGVHNKPLLFKAVNDSVSITEEKGRGNDLEEWVQIFNEVIMD
jgi:hypothetical protein